jgi:kynurenine formamidase
MGAEIGDRMESLTFQMGRLLGNARFVDISPVLSSSMDGWQSHPDITIISDSRSHERDGYYLQLLVMPEHVGSHVDAPAHVHESLMHRTIDTFPVDTLLRPGKKISAASLDLRPGDQLTLADFTSLADEQGVRVHAGDIVLVEFGWDKYKEEAEPEATGAAGSWWGGNAPGFAEDLCAWLAGVGPTAVGTDTAACDIAVKGGKILSSHGHDTYFLPKDILILEGLCRLDQVPGEFFFMALPLHIHAGSGSPIRAVAVCGTETNGT